MKARAKGDMDDGEGENQPQYADRGSQGLRRAGGICA